jgi:ATP-dependent RNA helicase DeaD
LPFQAIHPSLAEALTRQSFLEPTPVQAAVIAAESSADLLVSAQTGSGKTVAFGIAAATSLLGDEPCFGPAAEPLMLVVAPTRELALQVSREFEWLFAQASAVIATCVGGMDSRREQRALAQGAHIVVGTPGRLRDHLDRGNLDLASLRVVVLDEADEMLDMGFREDLEALLEPMPTERRTLMFSATLPRDIVALARRFQRDAVRIDTLKQGEPHGDIEYRVIRVAPNEIELAVVNVLRFFEAPGALIFCATREAVRHLHGALRERGFSAVALSGELSQKERADALHALREGHAQACVATDVAARGLDLPELGLVIHAELPQNRSALLHRSGRTGRAGKKGLSVLLAPYNKRRKAEILLESAGVRATWSGPPSAEEIRARDQQRMLQDPIFLETPSPEDLSLARRLLAERSPEAIATALVRLHGSRLPEPEELFDGGGEAPRGRQERDGRPERGTKAERPDRPREPRGATADATGVWFRLKVGRQQNADPKWLVPLICRLGHVTKKDIGAIRIFERETKFEITLEAADHFRQAIQAAAQSGDMRVEPANPPPPREERGSRPPRPAGKPPVRPRRPAPQRR